MTLFLWFLEWLYYKLLLQASELFTHILRIDVPAMGLQCDDRSACARKVTVKHVSKR